MTVSNDNDNTLFRDAMRDVAPLAKSDKVILPHACRAPIHRQTPQDDKETPVDPLSDHISLEIAAGDGWSFIRPGMSRQTLRRLRRGYWANQAHLDLHGFTRDEARIELVMFLDNCIDNDFRCVCIIHGKGFGSTNNEPVLKIRVGNWLAQRNDVLAFCQARPENGGGGAVVVLLKTSRR